MKSCYDYDQIVSDSGIAGMVSVENEDHIMPCDNAFARHSKAGNAGYLIQKVCERDQKELGLLDVLYPNIKWKKPWCSNGSPLYAYD